ncbi:hypothetical protein TPHA_0A02150 [Tetrapisispora phaffii CBS 4417]|uniref:Inositolphosphotransferase Aur1/Ipt1 domain-containing protein n=1 Tax=Tetrapisispora phaffii (strain ATCC 24235 / CBS 4417 / NBRC 1672 / NRRL Y-8282 / UCD 70-5) TaxID=1071381 RepID=G8BN19_TETPH|nr:hypothetical protein TPHA_0A02150 [Tetrapisispora phaffii CBS 4417]CCE61297.1 hypothetical protein TPHA_0A02150 [Tetrapisispora phaffii CBS 4417]
MVFIVNVVKRLYNGAINKRNLITLPLNFLINFSLIFLWLQLFGHAGIVPNDIRPKINSHIAFFADLYLFGDYWNEIKNQGLSNHHIITTFATSFAFLVIGTIVVPLSIWYYLYYVKRLKYNFFNKFDYLLHYNVNTQTFSPKHFRSLFLPFFLPLFTFIILNIDHYFASQNQENFTKAKDLLAWTFYVILHVTAPILTAVYLYVFHPAGVLKCFALTLGIQNICGVFTHMLLPMAPPWFTHMYGIYDTEHVNYTQEGFAAGLTRFDAHLGSHMNTNGFHLSPIVFGAVPSIHSAIGFQCFLFLVATSTKLKNRFVKNTMHNRLSQSSDDSASDVNIEYFDLNSDKSFKLSNEQSFDQLEINDYNEQRLSQPQNEAEEYVAGSMHSYSSDALSTISGMSENAENTVSLNTNKKSPFVEYYIQDIGVSSRFYFRILNIISLPRVLGFLFITIQWWATIYLDHHYRFDLFIGMLYALFANIFINQLLLQPKIMEKFIDIRLGKKADDDNEGRTMGMRVFKGTKYEWFFDPLA